MSTFVPSYSISQSSDGRTLTLTDTSNWVSNTEGYIITNFARSILLNDAFDELITTVTFTGTDLVETYTLIGDKWVKSYFTITGTPTFNLDVQQYAFYRQFQVAYRNAIKQGCGCGCGNIDLCSVDAFVTTAQFAIPVGNGEEFQNDIDAANAYLNQ